MRTLTSAPFRCTLAILGTLAFMPAAGAPQQIEPAAFDPLHYRFIGPRGNRAIAVVGVPGDPMISFVGAASGGVWKTVDGGISWHPMFDDEPVQSIGSLAIPASQPNTIWAGTGETFLIRPAHALGNGIYRSDDVGQTWRPMGLEKTGRIGRIVIHPTNPDIVFACALGHAHGPQQERGVYRTTNGGQSWERVLFVDENTGCADLAMDPGNPRTLFAGLWQVDVKWWDLKSGGTSGGAYVSRDGGTTWKKLSGNGLPAANRPVGKTAVAIAPSNPQRVYVLMEDSTPSLYRSNDGGETWRLVNRDHLLAERSPYYTRLAVAPDDPNRLYFPCVSWSVSYDGGESFVRTEASAGGDNHDVWIDPLNPRRIMVANDGGASISMDRGQTYSRVTLPIAQMYHVWVDNEIPYNVYGNMQDGGASRGPSNSLGGGIRRGSGRVWAVARTVLPFPIRRTATSSGPAATMASSTAWISEPDRRAPSMSGRMPSMAGGRPMRNTAFTGCSRWRFRPSITTGSTWAARWSTRPPTAARAFT